MNTHTHTSHAHASVFVITFPKVISQKHRCINAQDLYAEVWTNISDLVRWKHRPTRTGWLCFCHCFFLNPWSVYFKILPGTGWNNVPCSGGYRTSLIGGPSEYMEELNPCTHPQVWQNIACAVQSLFYGVGSMLQLQAAHPGCGGSWRWDFGAACSVYFQFLEHIFTWTWRALRNYLY